MPNKDPRVKDGGDAQSPHVVLQQCLGEGRFSPGALMQWMIHAYRYSRLAHAMVTLGIADELLRDGPVSTDALAASKDVSTDHLDRLLRGLAWMGAVVRVGADRWGLTPMGRHLAVNTEGSLCDDALHAGNLLYPAWGALTKGLAQQRVPFELAFECGFFEQLGDDSDGSDRFDRVMNRIARGTAEAAALLLDLRGVRRLIDVGGGNGETLVHLLRAAPDDMHGVVFDRRRSEPAALANLASHGLAQRGSFVAGDFFESVPIADLYVLQRILHDWSDDECVGILTNVANAMEPEGRVLVLEELLSSDPGPRDHAIGIDMAMMVVTGGRERTQLQYEAIARRAGLRLVEGRPTAHGVWLLEFVR